jgi:hypothetical protein
MTSIEIHKITTAATKHSPAATYRLTREPGADYGLVMLNIDCPGPGNRTFIVAHVHDLSVANRIEFFKPLGLEAVEVVCRLVREATTDRVPPEAPTEAGLRFWFFGIVTKKDEPFGWREIHRAGFADSLNSIAHWNSISAMPREFHGCALAITIGSTPPCMVEARKDETP